MAAPIPLLFLPVVVCGWWCCQHANSFASSMDEAYLHGRPPPRPINDHVIIPLIHHHHHTTTTTTTTITITSQPSLPLPTRNTCCNSGSRFCYHCWLQSESRSSANQGPTDPRYLSNRFLLNPPNTSASRPNSLS